MLARSLLPLSLLCLAVDAIRIPFTTKSRTHSKLTQLLLAGDCTDASCGELGNIMDSVYISNITVGGQDFEVLLDTGSSDLWVNCSLHPIPSAQIMSNVIVSEVYGDQSNYTGPVGFAPVQFHGFTVANQSFTCAQVSENDNTANLNVTGLIGLSFDGLSLVSKRVSAATGSKTAGQTFLSNVFAANPNQPNFISFFLSREADLNNTSNNGAFTISEVEQGFDAINNQKQIPLFPPGNVEWTVPLDQLLISGNPVSLPSSVVSTSSSVQSVMLLDTGTSSIFMPSNIASSFYTQIPGAKPARIPGGSTLWVLPCSAEPPSMALVLGGQTIPVHPLDLNAIGGVYRTSSGKDVTVCFGGITGSDPLDGRFDMLLGSPFLRNVYTTFNFGSNNTASSASPFVRLLSVTDPSQASQDFKNTRKAQLNAAPEASSDQIAEILGGDPSFTQIDPPSLTGTPKSGAAHLEVSLSIALFGITISSYFL